GLAAAAALGVDNAGLPGEVVKTFLAWIDAQRSAKEGDSWITERLEYRFAVSGSTTDGEVVLAAPDYLGGRLDWHDLEVDEDATHSLAAPARDGDRHVVHLLP